jgi:hypothetical protein
VRFPARWPNAQSTQARYHAHVAEEEGRLHEAAHLGLELEVCDDAVSQPHTPAASRGQEARTVDAVAEDEDAGASAAEHGPPPPVVVLDRHLPRTWSNAFEAFMNLRTWCLHA